VHVKRKRFLPPLLLTSAVVVKAFQAEILKFCDYVTMIPPTIPDIPSGIAV
jgi:hypothetical protein